MSGDRGPLGAGAARVLVAGQFAAALALLLVFTELGSFVALRLLAWRAAALPLPQGTMPSYGGEPWADTFWREQRRQMSVEYRPFGLWRSRPFEGRTIVVGGDGLRRTVHSRCPADETVFLFGGSSVWGFGSPDWETLPSHLAARYEAAGRPACVVNYGEDSWRIAQGAVELLLELRRGRRPDRVVFVNGCNDVFTPFFLTGRADVEWDYARAKPWLEELARPGRGSFAFLEATNTWALLQRARARLGGAASHPSPPDPGGLARAVAEAYLRDMDVVEALGRSYGFRPLFVLQPLALAGSKRLTPEEEQGVRRQLGGSYELGRDAVRRTYALLRASGRGRLHDASDAFDAEPESVYIDACHFLPRGNRIMAERLFTELSSGGPQ
ncbi:MAG TPA: hypothetical protein VFM88_10730 [Vicinamibacteria bacterium]|nr:hypothetical protein [Vicinamibacteria bacterium]